MFVETKIRPDGPEGCGLIYIFKSSLLPGISDHLKITCSGPFSLFLCVPGHCYIFFKTKQTSKKKKKEHGLKKTGIV